MYLYKNICLCTCIHMIFALVHVSHFLSTMSVLSRFGNLLYLDFKYLLEGLIKVLNFSFGHAGQILPITSVTRSTESDPAP